MKETKFFWKNNKIYPISKESEELLRNFKNGDAFFIVKAEKLGTFKQHKMLHAYLRSFIDNSEEEDLTVEHLKDEIAFNKKLGKFVEAIDREGKRISIFKRHSFSYASKSAEDMSRIIQLCEDYCKEKGFCSIRENYFMSLGEVDFKREYIKVVQNYKCSISGEFLENNYELHHVLHNTEYNRIQYKNFINSIANLYAVNKRHHTAKPQWYPDSWKTHQNIAVRDKAADDIECFLQQDKKLSDFLNNPTHEKSFNNIENDFFERYKEYGVFSKYIKGRLISNETKFYF